MATFCIDWDDTCVDAKTQAWLDGAERALRKLYLNGHTVVIYTVRANYPRGKQQVEEKLATIDLPLQVVPKLFADAYIDDRALLFTGDWPGILRELRHSRFSTPRNKRRLP